MESKEREEVRNRTSVLCQHLGSWGECVVKISKHVAKILKCVAEISEFVVHSKCVFRRIWNELCII